jgi:hypothetical protein
LEYSAGHSISPQSSGQSKSGKIAKALLLFFDHLTPNARDFQ